MIGKTWGTFKKPKINKNWHNKYIKNNNTSRVLKMLMFQ
jgi:hypothetical protein